MTASSSYPDHVTLLGLLWRTDDPPSPRTGLTITKIVGVGIAIADAEELAAVTMRRVASELGVGAMSLYTYVPGKDELVTLMTDTVYGELRSDAIPGATWQQRIRAMGDEHWDLVTAHPWLVDVPLTRPVVGPNISDRYEAELVAIDGIGLDAHEMELTLELVARHVSGAARKAVDINRDAEASGMSDDEWWHAILPTLTTVMSDRHYPVAARVGGEVGAPHTDPRRDLEFGLDLLIAGIEARLTRP